MPAHSAREGAPLRAAACGASHNPFVFAGERMSPWWLFPQEHKSFQCREGARKPSVQPRCTQSAMCCCQTGTPAGQRKTPAGVRAHHLPHHLPLFIRSHRKPQGTYGMGAAGGLPAAPPALPATHPRHQRKTDERSLYTVIHRNRQ